MPDAMPHSITQASSGELCRALFEQAAVGIAQIDTATGRFVRVNRRYCEIIGLNEQDMTATTFMAITHPDDLQPDLDNMEELKAGRRRDFSMEKRLFRSDGSTRWVNLTVSPMWSPGETPTSHLAIVEDITDRKQAEAKLLQFTRDLEQQVRQRAQESEESRRRLQAILDGTSDAVFVKDLHGRYLLLNRAAGEFVGKSPNQVMGQDDTFIFSPADALAVMDGDRKVMAAGETKTYEDVATTADGVQRTFLSTKGPLFDAEGHVVGLFGISRDITERKSAEARIQESETRFRRLFEEAYLGMCLMGADKTLLRVNRAFCALVGYDEQELVGRTYAVYTHPDDLKANLEFTDRFLRGEIPGYQIEKRYIRKNGEVRWVNVSVSLTEREAARGGCLATIEDITERKRVEQALQQLNTSLEQRVTERTNALRESDRRFTELLQTVRLLAVVVGPEGRIQYCNPYYLELTGYQEEQVEGRDYVATFVPLEDQERIRSTFLPAIERETFPRHFENDILCHDGTRRTVSWANTVLRDPDGAVLGMASIGEDVTHRRQAEAALRLSEERFRLVAEATNDILWDWDLVTGQHWWSPNAKSKFGYDPVKEPSLEAWSSRLHPDDRERVTNRLHHIVLTPDGTPFVEEYRFLMRDGSYGFFQDKAQVFRDTQGRPVRMIGAMIDVTAAKQAYVTLQGAYARHQALSRELQVAAEHERRRLSRELHDEFGQLLGALKFDVSRIADDVQRARAVTPAMVSKKLRVVRKTVDRLFSSLREMVRGLRPAVLDELGLVPSLEALAHEVQEHSGLRCRFVADRDDLGKVFGPELESTIFRVTQELLTNVVRHADASVVRIDLNARDGWAQLTVRDNGRGMNQGRGVNKASVNGRGQFGLRGVRERAELLGGQVEILSQVDQGTMVTVRIPFVPPTDRSRAASGRKPGGTSTTRKRVTRGQAL